MMRGNLSKPIDNTAVSVTSAPINCMQFDGLMVLVHDEKPGAVVFTGTITVQVLLAGTTDAGVEGTSGTVYKQTGAPLTLDRVEYFYFIAPKVKIDVVRTAGAVSVWAQPFSVSNLLGQA